jgi:hypothetical protein
VKGGRRFANAALVVEHCDSFVHVFVLPNY